MRRVKTAISGFWPSHVHEWLSKKIEWNTLSEEERFNRSHLSELPEIERPKLPDIVYQSLIRIASDPRMEYAAEKFDRMYGESKKTLSRANVGSALIAQRTHTPDIEFLELIIRLPEIVEFYKNETKELRLNRTSELVENLEKLTRLCRNSPGLIEFSLALSRKDSTQGGLGYEQLLMVLRESTNAIKDFGTAYSEGVFRGIAYPFSREDDPRKEPERFAIRYVADFTKELFGKPMRRLIGIAVPVSLGISGTVSPRKVKRRTKKGP